MAAVKLGEELLGGVEVTRLASRLGHLGVPDERAVVEELRVGRQHRALLILAPDLLVDAHRGEAAERGGVGVVLRGGELGEKLGE